MIAIEKCLMHCPPVYSPLALKAAYEAGFDSGVEAAANPIYKSLDGKTIINSPLELIDSIGNNLDSAVFRVNHILLHSEKRRLNSDEIEVLRMAQAALSFASVDTKTLCDEGQEIVAKLEKTVTRYEEEFNKKN